MNTRACALAFCLVGTMLVAASTHADQMCTELGFPNWRVTTSEDMSVRWRETNGRKRYSIANLFDGDLATAWVFEGKKWDWREDFGVILAPGERYASDGGVGHWIVLRSLAEQPPLADAVGIVNGYAKSAAIYQRNNHITRILIDKGADWSPRSEPIRTADLEEVMWMQVIPIPETRVDFLRITVTDVTRGGDDDLCISELQLYHEGRALIEKPPHHTFYGPGSSCGCGYEVYMVDSTGRYVLDGDPPSRIGGFSYHFFDRGRRAALYQEGETVRITVADVPAGRVLHRIDLPDSLRYCRWLDGPQLLYMTRQPSGDDWYELDVSRPDAQPRPTKAPPGTY